MFPKSGGHAILLQRFEFHLRNAPPSRTPPRPTSPQQTRPPWHRQSIQLKLATKPCKPIFWWYSCQSESKYDIISWYHDKKTALINFFDVVPVLKPSPCDSSTIPGHVGLLLSPVDGSRNGLRVSPGKQLGPVRARIPWQSLQSRRQLHEHLPEHKPPTPICELFGLYNIHVVCALCKRRQCLCSDLNWKSLPTFSLCKLHSAVPIFTGNSISCALN